MKGHLEQRETNKKLPRGVCSWTIVIETGRTAEGRRTRRRFPLVGTKRQAESELAERIHQLETGALLQQDRITVAEYLQYWLGVYARPNTSPRTYERYEEIVRLHLSPALGGHRLTKLTPLHIQKHYQESLVSGRKVRRASKSENANGSEHSKAKQERNEVDADQEEKQEDANQVSLGLSARTVLHHHRVLNQALRQAVKWRMILRNPAEAVQPPRPQTREMNALDEKQAVKLLRGVEGTRMDLPVLLALSTGLRRGDLLGLRWDDVDLKNGALHVRRSLQDVGGELIFGEPKTARSKRRVAIPQGALARLKEHKKAQNEQRRRKGPAYQNDNLVFCRDDGRAWHPGSFLAEWQKAAKSLGLSLRWHDLRHTHATLLLRAGEHPKVVSERLGHSTVAITLDTFSHVLPDQQERAAERFDALMTAAENAVDGG